MPSGSLRERLGPLGASGGLWEPSGASGRLRQPLRAFGSLRGPLGAFGSLWEPSGASRGLPGAFREPLGASGASRKLLGASGSLREPQKALRSLWEPLGASGSLRESIYVAFKPRFNIARCEAVDTRLRVFMNLSKIIGSEHPGLLKLHGYAGHGPIVVHSHT